MNLIVVESPTKARTFNRILKGKDYFVFATFGHIRDLPKNKLAIDYQKNFFPDYQLIKNKEKVIKQLKEIAKKNQQIILATDPDREGESIAYHIAFVLGFVKENWPNFTIENPKNGQQTLKRIVFHEITSSALTEALKNPQDLRVNLVKAQQARRILDRIVGYELSPLLWKKTGKNWLSAGRVQTVALRLVVEREKEIKNFKIEDYYQIFANFQSISEKKEMRGKLISKEGIVYEEKKSISLFDGDYSYTKTTINEKKAEEIKKDLLSDQFSINKIEEKVSKRYPSPPYTTSLLQQDAFFQNGFSSKMTMKLAQDLYEQGLITYHRTDSFSLSTQFVFKARDYIINNFGEEYALDKPRGYKTKSKLAQEAHEAIRPTKLEKEPKALKKLTKNHHRLYQMIFKRALATQMKEAEIKEIKIYILSQKGYLFQAEKEQVLFDGFFRVWQNKTQAVIEEFVFKENDRLSLIEAEIKKETTRPPYRYNEASLIKALEEKGIGRPSTYAIIISLIQEKNYVEKQNRYLIPTKLGGAICDYLSQSFSQIFDLNFTAKMEEGLDEIANDNKEMVSLLNEFYQPFINELEKRKNDQILIDTEEKIEEKCSFCQSPLMVRYSKYGKFLACSRYPDCKFTKPLLKYVDGKKCPQCEGKVVIRYTKTKKKFYGCDNYPQCKWSSWRLTK
ncbi:MAG: type I DNA topoisomerase [Patescibacteria group bacterium]|nr:type I DNA topoisomerase [Patescibacteria group bacterium]